MEVVITILCLLAFILTGLIFESRYQIDKLNKRVNKLSIMFKLKSEMNDLNERVNRLGGGPPNEPEPAPPPPPEDD